MSDATSACFSRDGKYLFFAASSNYGLNTGWLDLSSLERPVLNSLYVAVLSKEDPSPLASESDDEKLPETSTEPKPAEDKNIQVQVKIDLQGLNQRILCLPVPERNYHHLQSAEGKLFFLETLPNQPLEAPTRSSQLNAYDLKERKSDLFVDKVQSYWVQC